MRHLRVKTNVFKFLCKPNLHNFPLTTTTKWKTQFTFTFRDTFRERCHNNFRILVGTFNFYPINPLISSLIFFLPLSHFKKPSNIPLFCNQFITAKKLHNFVVLTFNLDSLKKEKAHDFYQRFSEYKKEALFDHSFPLKKLFTIVSRKRYPLFRSDSWKKEWTEKSKIQRFAKIYL